MRLYDAHNHLQQDLLRPHLSDVLDRCEQIGIVGTVVNGTCEADWDDVLTLARSRPWIVPSFGYHPWYLDRASVQWRETLVGYLDQIPAAIGEVGLDGSVTGPSRVIQEEFFLAQLEIAAQRNLPVSIHCVKAWGRLIELLSTQDLPRCGFLIHSYTGSRELIEPLTKLGAYFSCSGSLLSPSKADKLEAFGSVPRNRLLIETDAPEQCVPEELDLYTLRDAQARRLNHPANLVVVYQKLAEFLTIPLAELCALVEQNFYRLFRSPYTRE
jgi:TatD DNase family protein